MTQRTDGATPPFFSISLRSATSSVAALSIWLAPSFISNAHHFPFFNSPPRQFPCCCSPDNDTDSPRTTRHKSSDRVPPELQTEIQRFQGRRSAYPEWLSARHRRARDRRNAFSRLASREQKSGYLRKKNTYFHIYYISFREILKFHSV